MDKDKPLEQQDFQDLRDETKSQYAELSTDRAQQEQADFMRGFKAGDNVRCFTFFGERILSGPNASYVEGNILIVNSAEDEITVRITREVVDGVEVSDNLGHERTTAASPSSIDKL